MAWQPRQETYAILRGRLAAMKAVRFLDHLPHSQSTGTVFSTVVGCICYRTRIYTKHSTQLWA